MFLLLIIFTSVFVAINCFSYKTNYNPYQYSVVSGVTIMRRAIASGVATALAMGIIAKSLVNPLPNHLGLLILGIFFVIGAIIGYTSQRTF